LFVVFLILLERSQIASLRFTISINNPRTALWIRLSILRLDVVGRFAICRVGHGADILSWTEANKKGGLMKLTALIEREGDGYVSLCPEVDIASQGDTIESARDNLREALELFFETASPEEIKQRLHDEVFITQVEVTVG
jgi:predicted RNase H-like HicB family nuclease